MELKVNELRIGNFLHDRKNELCKVESLSTKEYSEISAPVIGHCITSLPHKLIPLTEEWLLKLGFSLLEESVYKIKLNCGNFLIINTYHKIAIIGFEYDDETDQQLEYPKNLHQLQNLYFALTQTELTIKE